MKHTQFKDLKGKDKKYLETGIDLPLLRVDEALLTLIPSVNTSAPIRVVGKVEKVNDRYDQWVYGKISGKESRMSFRIPKEEGCPPVGRQVVLVGVFSIRPARFHEGLETVLSGQIDPRSKERLEIREAVRTRNGHGRTWCSKGPRQPRLFLGWIACQTSKVDTA